MIYSSKINLNRYIFRFIITEYIVSGTRWVSMFSLDELMSQFNTNTIIFITYVGVRRYAVVDVQVRSAGAVKL